MHLKGKHSKQNQEMNILKKTFKSKNWYCRNNKTELETKLTGYSKSIPIRTTGIPAMDYIDEIILYYITQPLDPKTMKNEGFQPPIYIYIYMGCNP